MSTISLWYKRNTTLWAVLLYQNNQPELVNSHITLSQYELFYYNSMVCHVVPYNLLIMLSASHQKYW